MQPSVHARNTASMLAVAAALAFVALVLVWHGGAQRGLPSEHGDHGPRHS